MNWRRGNRNDPVSGVACSLCRFKSSGARQLKWRERGPAFRAGSRLVHGSIRRPIVHIGLVRGTPATKGPALVLSDAAAGSCRARTVPDSKTGRPDTLGSKDQVVRRSGPSSRCRGHSPVSFSNARKATQSGCSQMCPGWRDPTHCGHSRRLIYRRQPVIRGSGNKSRS